MKNTNGESLVAVHTHTHTHTQFVTKELIKLFLNKIASILVEQKNNIENINNIEGLNNIEYINNIKDRLFFNKEIACPFCCL